MRVKRGDIYWVEFDPAKGSEQAPTGSGQAGLRPALVIQNDVGNQYSPTTIAAVITRRLPRERYPFVVIIEPDESGLPERSAVNCSELATIQQASPAGRLRPPPGEPAIGPIGHLAASKMAEVDQALCYGLGISQKGT